MAIRDLARNALDPGGSSVQFLGYRPPRAEPFPYKIYEFLIKPIRDEDALRGALFLKRWIQGQELDFKRTYEDIKSILLTFGYKTCPAGMLKYLRWKVGFSDDPDVAAVVEGLSELDTRRLIKAAVPVWKQKGTDAAYQSILLFFGAKRLKINNWFYYRWLLEEGVIGEDLDYRDPWLVAELGSDDPDEYITDIRLMDEQLSTINRTVVKHYLKLVRPGSERINLVYVDFLDDFRDPAMLEVVQGTIDLDKTFNEGLLWHFQEDTLVTTVSQGQEDWTQPHVMWRTKVHTQVMGDAANKARLLFAFVDANNHMFIELDMGPGTGMGTVRLGRRKAAAEVVLATVTSVPMDFDAFYTWRLSVIEYENPLAAFAPTLQYKIMQDRNLILEHHEAIGVDTLSQGYVATQSFKALLAVDELEVFQWPVEVEHVYPELTVIPRTGSVVFLGSINFAAFGGAKPYTFDFEQNNSGGTIGTDGSYTAGVTPGVTDQIRVTDNFGTEVIAYIDVTATP